MISPPRFGRRQPRACVAPGGDPEKRGSSKILRADAEVDYWEGED
jgi:hypothetical protein